MRIVLLAFLFIATSGPRAFSQFTAVDTDDPLLRQLFNANDSTFRKVVDRVYFSAQVAQRNNSPFTIDVTSNINGIVKLPNWVSGFTLKERMYKVVFKGYLYEFLHGDSASVALDLLGNFSTQEKQMLHALRKATMNERSQLDGSSESVVVYGSDGKPRLEYFEIVKETLDLYTESQYETIPFRLTYTPVYADVYLVPKSEWVYNYKLAYPPVASQVLKRLPNLFKTKISRAESSLTVDLCERTYVVVYHRDGKLKFGEVKPSTKNVNNNSASINLQNE